jgi:predicted nucleic acid-binding protein
LIALDTNILIYAAGKNDVYQRDIRARDLLDRISPIPTIVPVQVLGEFLSVCRRTQILALNIATLIVNLWLSHYRCPTTAAVDLTLAADISGRFNLQYFDALILTVARRAGATVLLSEDMQDGLEVEGIRVINPFVSDNETLISGFL